MLIIKYCGGLGNQMYQYALQYALSVKYPNETIKADLNHYNLLDEHNGFELGKYFGIDVPSATKAEIKNVYNGFVPNYWMKRLPYKFRYSIAHKYQYIYLKVRNLVFRNKYDKTINGHGHNIYSDVLFHLNKGDWYINGLWQNLKYFDDHRNELKKIFKLERILESRDQKILEKIKLPNSVSIHVRGGDFKKSKFDICSEGYYREAIEIIKKDVQNPQYFFFTDDVDLVETIFSDINNKIIISHPVHESILDMYMMSCSYNNIISNSTFSFWSAYLKEEDYGIVIAPKYSIIDSKGAYEFSIPDEWVALNPFIKN